MTDINIALIGAGSRSFGPGTVRDILLSETLAPRSIGITLMDTMADHLAEIAAYTKKVADKLGRRVEIKTTTSLEQALTGIDAVVAAIEVNRYFYWSQDFHIPRKYGFRQVYGENGGPGGLFHALRNMGPMVEIARAMERICPKAPLLNFTNPEHKLCEAISRLTKTRSAGLCHGVFMGMEQVADILEKPVEEIDFSACGINHFTWFQKIRDKKTGADLYPELKRREAEGDLLSNWHELALARILFRRFGLWPSPAPNHYGEYIRWADEFVVSEVQYFYDPAAGNPWQTGKTPGFIYSLSSSPHERPFKPAGGAASSSIEEERAQAERDALAEADEPLEPSGELAIPMIEAVVCGESRELDAINIPNCGAIPGLPDDMVVEVPATADAKGWRAHKMDPLPEAVTALLHVQGSIQKLLVEAFAERSRDKLIQAVLLEPAVDSYRQAVEFVDEMTALQREILPPFK
jgi:alpha-galactosidase